MASLLRPSPKHVPPLEPFISLLVVSTLISFAATAGGPTAHSWQTFARQPLLWSVPPSLETFAWQPQVWSVPPSLTAFARQSFFLELSVPPSRFAPFSVLCCNFDKPSGDVVACRLPIETENVQHSHTHTLTNASTCA